MTDPSSIPASLLKSGGPLLSTAQFMCLLGGAAAEGVQHGSDLEIPDEEILQSPAFRREWQDLLAAIALFGPARVVLPPNLAAEFDIQYLLEEEIAEILVVDTTVALKAQIARTYEEAYKRCRELEWNPATTPLISLDTTGLREGDRLEARLVASDAEYYVDRLGSQVTAFVSWLSDIFGYYVEANEAGTFEAIRDYNKSKFFDAATTDPMDPAHRTVGLLQMMGLYVRSRGLLEQESKALQIPGICYGPENLADFDDLDRELTSPSESFSDFAALGLVLKQYEPAGFLHVHAFWRTFFELINMLRVSEAEASPLFLPSAAPVRPEGDSSQWAEATDEHLQMFRLFLTETGRLPSPNSLKELHRLRQDPGLSSLRSILSHWAETARKATDGDVPLLNEMRGDIANASRRLRRAESLGRAGRIISFASLPVAVYDLLRGSALGTSLAPLGPAIDAYSLRLKHNASWVRFGDL